MTDDHNPLSSLDRQRLLAVLAEREAGQPADALTDADEATIGELQAELATLVDDLRQPPPECDFEEESDCRRAIELVESIGRSADASASDAAGMPGDISPVGASTIERLGPYEVTAKLGEGGMGAVYKAMHPKLKRTVAIKVLPSRRLRDAAAVARFEREMEAIGSLNHPNIVTAHDAGEDAGMHYLVMEYVDGVDLATLVRRVGPLAPADACEIVRQAALGLAAAQARGIVHRDVKPSNLMLAAATVEGAAPALKVLDFGLARLSPLRAEGDELTTSGLIMGTLKYMAPEQCSHTHSVDARADVYSLGATLYKLLSGASPYADERFNSPLVLLAALNGEEPPPLAAHRPDVPPQLAAVVHRMLEKDPARRLASASDVVDALAPWSRGADLDALLGRASKGDRAAPPATSSAGHAAAVSAKSASTSSRRAPWIALPLIIAALATVGVVVFRTGENKRVDVEAHGRSVIEWLTTQGAEFGVSNENGTYVVVRAGEQLPAGRIQLNNANLEGNKELADEDLARFDRLPFFTTLAVSLTNIGDEGLRYLGALPLLQQLYLSGTVVTDEGLRELGRYPKLEVLHLSDTKITDAGLEFLRGHVLLFDLSLIGCSVTDEGLTRLTGFPRLRILALNRTGVTPLGIVTLQQSLPECEIRSDYSEEEIAAALESLPKNLTQPEVR